MASYIYIRQNKYWKLDNVCKIGYTTNIPDRNGHFVTCEPIRGKFTHVFEFYCEKIGLDIEKKIRNFFDKYHFNGNGGTEFFYRNIIELIEPFFIKNGLKYKKLTEYEINRLSRKQREKISKFGYENREYQTEIINKSMRYFMENDKGLLILMCGVGKTIISILIAKGMNMKTILIGVPNIILLEQWTNIVKKIFNYSLLKVSGRTNNEKIIKFLGNKKNKIMITTYASAYKIYEITEDKNIVFDMIILDEVHHLTTSNITESEEKKSFVKILNIKSHKQIGLTATLKYISDGNSISNKDIKYFGNIIEHRSLLWAIQNKIICDYEIQTLICDDINKLTGCFIDNENDKRLLFSAFSALESIKQNYSHHLLIYSNNIENSDKIIKFLDILQKKFNIDDIYYSKYDSNMKKNDKIDIINDFKKYDYGIISCVYCLGEGWDFPLLDGVIFSENMSSTIRIVQSALRPCRKYQDEPNKINKIILPILNTDFNDNNKDLKKVREVIYQIGLEDETIIQKIKVFNISGPGPRPGPRPRQEIGEFDKELTDKLRLFRRTRRSLEITYKKAKKIICDNGKIKTKEDYYELCEKDDRLSREPELFYSNDFLNWVDYLSIDKTQYYDMNECKKKCNEYLRTKKIIIIDILDYSKICNDLCVVDSKFPPNGMWTDCYDINDVDELIIIPKNNNINSFDFFKNL